MGNVSVPSTTVRGDRSTLSRAGLVFPLEASLYLIQILLPLYDNAGAPLPRELYDDVREELTRRFGGLTAFTRAPAEGH
jgi:hypothetical protein